MCRAKGPPGAMAVNVERSCTMLVHFDKASSASEIRAALEGNDADAKVQAMQRAIMMLLNGESLPALFITIVRYVLPSEDHTVQKLLLLYLVRSLPLRPQRSSGVPSIGPSAAIRCCQLCGVAQSAAIPARAAISELW